MSERSANKYCECDRMHITFTRLDADVMEATNRIAAVQRPVHAYKGKKGSESSLASCDKHATKASTGPVDPMIVNGCAAVRAYTTPQKAVELIISCVAMNRIV
jgi:hypothetical protein